MAALDNFALVAGSQASAHGPVKFDTITFTGPTYNKVDQPTVNNPTGNTGLLAGLRGLTGDSRKPISVTQACSAGDYDLQYEPSTDRLKIVVSSTGAEVNNGEDLSRVTFRALCISQ